MIKLKTVNGRGIYLRLAKPTFAIKLQLCYADGEDVENGNILYICEDSEKFTRFEGINRNIGLCLDPYGRMQISVGE